MAHSSNIQSTIALSTGESEYYALVKGGSVGLGLQSLCADLGLDLEVTIQKAIPMQPKEPSTELDWVRPDTSKLVTYGCRKGLPKAT